MKFGIFNVPNSLGYTRGQRTAGDVLEWDLQLTRWADAYGLSESFFAEHYTIGREPCPAPDVMIAAASQVTTQITLGAAAHLLPYHNPMSLAHRIMWLDHMTRGRYIAGIAPGAFPTDAQLFGTGSENATMMEEALEIILSIWANEGPFRIEGRHWTCDMPAYSDTWQGPHLKPWQTPHPPIAIVGVKPTSPSLAKAGERGFIPISQELSSRTLSEHWETYSQAALAAGRTPRREDWRVTRDFFVAESDDEAFDAVLNGGMGEFWREYQLPVFKTPRQRPGDAVPTSLAPSLVGDDGSEKDLSVEWLAENFWLIGSPSTVAEKIRRLYHRTGGFGTVLTLTYDYIDNPELVRRSFELLNQEVMPLVADLQA